MPGLPDLDQLLQVLIGPGGVELGLEAVVKQFGYALPEGGRDAALVIFDNLVGRDAGFPADEFQQQSSLLDAHLAERALEILEQLLLHGVDVALPPESAVMLRVQGAVHFPDQMAGGNGIRVHARESPDQPVIVSPFFLALALAPAENEGRRQVVQVGGVPVFHLYAHEGAPSFYPIGLHFFSGHFGLLGPGAVHGRADMILGRCGERRCKKHQ